MKKKDNTPRKEDVISIKEALSNLLEQYSIKEKFDQAQLIAYWEEWMGKTIANHTLKLFIKRKKLYIQLSSASLKHTLLISKEKMIERINKDFETIIVEDIVFL